MAVSTPLPIPDAAPSDDELVLAWGRGEDVPTPPTTLARLFEAAVRRHGARDALLWHGETTSYRALDMAANRLARGLRGRSVGPGTIVGICLPRGPELVTALLAVLKAGAAYVPVDPKLPAQRRAFLLEDSGAAICLVGDDDPVAPAHAEPLQAAGPGDLAYVIYTSGSTGQPKGVVRRAPRGGGLRGPQCRRLRRRARDEDARPREPELRRVGGGDLHRAHQRRDARRRRRGRRRVAGPAAALAADATGHRRRAAARPVGPARPGGPAGSAPGIGRRGGPVGRRGAPVGQVRPPRGERVRADGGDRDGHADGVRRAPARDRADRTPDAEPSRLRARSSGSSRSRPAWPASCSSAARGSPAATSGATSSPRSASSTIRSPTAPASACTGPATARAGTTTAARVPRPRRRAGQGPRPPDRARRDRGAPARASRRHRRRRRRPRWPAGRLVAYVGRDELPGADGAARLGVASHCHRRWCRRRSRRSTPCR